MKNIYIIGAGGHGRVILDILKVAKKKVKGFIDDDKKLKGKKVNGIPIVGSISALKRLAGKNNGFVIGIGNNSSRERFYKKAKQCGATIVNAIHPKAIIASDVIVGEGAVVMAGVVINTGSIIGNNTCINTSASVDHDNKIDDHAHIYPGARLTGGVKIGAFSYVGTAATVLPYLTVGKNVVIGPGAVVKKNVSDEAVVVARVSRVVKYKKQKGAK